MTLGDILVGVFAVCLVAQNFVQSWFLVRAQEAQLKQAQAYQALQKLTEMMDARVHGILSKYETPKTDPMQKQFDEIRKKAEQMGFSVESKPKPPRAPEPLIAPPPEPDEYVM